ncbi:uncharacterized protein LOC107036238 [Diachasma alloeum]|uniref:uncharacterized protein LOC107036238 n=1 Tax=Diachasma alloeum TaxID=454923 RepID=UPI0007382E53|nr:uncharacterized protein LOC107036238 [Diachasma alloeum]
MKEQRETEKMSSIERPVVGKSFKSHEEVVNYMKAWMDYEQVLFTRGKSAKLSEKAKNFDLVKYRTVEYTCKHGGTPYRSNTTDKRKTRSCKVNCPAKVKFQCLNNQGFFTITEINLDHRDHVSSQAVYEHYAEIRKLTSDQQTDTLKFLEMRCNKKLIQQDIHTKLGKHVTLKDLSNLKAQLKKQDDRELTEAVKFLIDEKGADVSILKNGNQFQGLYFSTPDMRRSFAAWPEIVAIDGTYSLLDSNLTVMLMVVEDSNAQSEIIAVGLLAVEDKPTMN